MPHRSKKSNQLRSYHSCPVHIEAEQQQQYSKYVQSNIRDNEE